MQKRLIDAAIVLSSVFWTATAIHAAPAKKSPAKKTAPKPAPRMVPLIIKLPRPPFTNRKPRIPAGFKVNGEWPIRKPRPTLFVPEGTTNLALNKPVTTSDKEPILGENAMVTDGNKEAGDGNYIEYAFDKQWVQIDLSKSANIYAIAFWHTFSEAVIYRDVVVQISDDADFVKGVKTVFNNDHDDSSGLGKGSDKEYFELAQGKLIPVKNTKGRYVRFYSNGSTGGSENRYTEIEIYGK